MSTKPADDGISIVIPTLNEVENVEPLLTQILEAVPRCREVIFVDDGSTDGTQARVRSLAAMYPVRLLERVSPTLGLSGAVIAGAQDARGEIVVVMDADLSHPPHAIGTLLEPLHEGRADMVIGSRYVKGGSTPGWPIYRKAMSRVAAACAYPLTRVHDSMSGFFAIRRELLLELAPRSTGFKIAFEIIARGGRSLRVLEMPIAFRDRARGTSKMSLAVALLFSARWVVAVGRSLVRPRPFHAPQLEGEAEEQK